MKGLIKFGKWVVCAVLIVWGISYCSDVQTRAVAKELEWDSELSPNDGGVYTAAVCYVTRDKILLRLYRTKDKELLAERMYLYMDAAKLGWAKDELIYNTSDDGGFIRLPPTLLDRLLARLP